MTWRYFIIIPFIILLALLIGESFTSAPFPLIALIACAFLGFITFQNPENGLMVIVFSMLLSPEIALGGLPGREITLRVDDLLIVAVFAAWLARIAVSKDWKGFIKTPLDAVLLFLLFLYLVSTFYGIVFGNIVPLKGLFYSLKYIEYFILFWVIVNVVTTKESVVRYLSAGLVTCLIVTLFAYSLFGKTGRVYAPFDTGGGEPASLGGYYLMIYAVLLSFLLHLDSLKARLLCLAMILFIMPPFVKTLSRASYLAFIPLVLTMFLLTRKRKIVFGASLLIFTLAFPFVFKGLYADLTQRIMVTFSGGTYVAAGSYYEKGETRKITDLSALERIASWKRVLKEKLTKNYFTAFAGNGVTGIGFVEGQFFLVLGEIGILGVAAFYFMLFKIAQQSYLIYKASSEVVPRSLSLALVSALVALVFQSFTTNTFIIVRIMEPFWFLTALVMVVPEVYRQQSETAAPGVL
ncbi:MAG: O-antigen ligase family protein [Endomicrobiales bacterium]